MDTSEFWTIVETARAGVIALGRDWYVRVAACPDSLGEHPAVIAAVGAYDDDAVFYEEVNYAADRAFRRLTDGERDFDDASHEYAASGDGSGEDSVDMGEDFDFDDPDEMRRRLPRLAALHLLDTRHLPVGGASAGA
ncbi:DUF4240 domain-containing protein [Streptomyces sp. NPDC054756]